MLKTLIISVATLLATQSAFALTVNLSGRHIVSTSFVDVEVIDRVCNRNMGKFRVKGNASIPIEVCTNSAGYGDIAVRTADNPSAWNGASFLRNGDNVYP